ncbi:unnamed protein product [Brassica rapa subsp. trilocularis]
MDLLDGFSAPPSSTDASPPCTNLSLTSDLVAAPLPTSSPQFPPSSSPELPVSTPSTVPEGPNGTVPCVSDCVNGTGPHGSDVVTCDNQSPPDTGATASASHDSGISATMEKLLRFAQMLFCQSRSRFSLPHIPLLLRIPIFLVNVDYTWIPSTCERCGNLGHKAKRCLLPSKPQHDPNLQQKEKDKINDEVPVVDIDLILQQREKDTSSSADIYLNNPLINGASLTAVSAHDIPLLHQMKELNVPSVVSAAEISQSLQSDLEVAPPLFTVSSDVSVDCQSTSNNTLSPLVDSQSTPITAVIMDSVPSNIINKEVQTPSIVDILTTSLQVSEFESPSRFTVLEEVDEVESEHMSSLSLTRGGRETKPPIKFQDLEWKTMQGKGKRGRCGRGSSH